MLDSSAQGIFLSYRRDDTGPYARSLQLQLSQRIPDARIFMDLDSIDPGLDFAEVIEQAVNSSAVLVALIGRQWTVLTDEDGARRLDNPNDYVRFEVKTAMDRGVRVIPVLIDGARPLRQQDLPEELHKLARLNAAKLSYERYQEDADRLLDLVQRVLAAISDQEEKQRKAQEEVDRQAQEKAEQEGRAEAERRTMVEADWQASTQQSATAQAPAETRAGAAAAPTASTGELPLPNYDDLTVASLRARLRNLSADQVTQLADYEKSHANREDVVQMYERRIAKLAEGYYPPGQTANREAQGKAQREAQEEAEREARDKADREAQEMAAQQDLEEADRLAREYAALLARARERSPGPGLLRRRRPQYHFPALDAGEAAAARDLCAALLPVRERVLGPEHPDTLETRFDLEFWTGTAGDAAAARDLCAALLPVYERVLGPEHWITVSTRHDLDRWTRVADMRAKRDLWRA